jgi:hypothetical protein
MTDSDAPKPNDAASAPPLEERSQFIRTYAKDMASLSGAHASALAPKRRRDEPAPEASKVETAADVKLEKAEGAAFSGPAQEVQELFKAPTEPAQKPFDTMAPAEPVAAPAPIEPPAPVPQAPSVDAEREAVLARLKKKLAESSQMQIETPRGAAARPPAPIEPPAEPMPVPIPAPVLPPEPAPVPPPAPRPAPLPPPTKKAEGDAPQRLHTYSSDFADRIDLKDASTFSVLAAQADATTGPMRPAAPRKPFPARQAVLIALGIVLLAGGSAGAYGAYGYLKERSALAPAQPVVPSLVFADEYKELSGSGLALQSSLAALAMEPLVDGNALVVYLTAATTTESGKAVSEPLPGGYLIQALALPAPSILFRNIEETSTVGIIRASGEQRPFFVLAASSYERTYAGMLTWEPLMARDLATFYPLYPAPEAPVSTTTASTTPIAPSVQPAALTRFADAVVANHPVRVLKDAAGHSLIVYGYADKATLIIARDEAAFEALLARIAAKR